MSIMKRDGHPKEQPPLRRTQARRLTASIPHIHSIARVPKGQFNIREQSMTFANVYERSRVLPWSTRRAGRSAGSVFSVRGGHLRQLALADLVHVHGARERHRCRHCRDYRAIDRGVQVHRWLDRHSAVRLTRAKSTCDSDARSNAIIKAPSGPLSTPTLKHNIGGTVSRCSEAPKRAKTQSGKSHLYCSHSRKERGNY